MPDKTTRDRRISRKVCASCNGKLDTKILICKKCKEYKIKWRKNHRQIGSCKYCTNPAVVGRAECEQHIKYQSELYKKRNQRRLKNGKCIGCGAILHEEMDEGFTHCLKCRQQIKVLVHENPRAISTTRL